MLGAAPHPFCRPGEDLRLMDPARIPEFGAARQRSPKKPAPAQ